MPKKTTPTPQKNKEKTIPPSTSQERDEEKKRSSAEKTKPGMDGLLRGGVAAASGKRTNQLANPQHSYKAGRVRITHT